MKVTALAPAVFLATGLASPRADACDDFAFIAEPLGYGLGVAMVGGYVGGIGYFGSHDLENDQNDRDYIGGDIAFNGVFAAAWGAGTVEAIRVGSGAAIPLAGLTALHGAMLIHGIEHANVDFRGFDSNAAVWTAGTLYSLQALAFVMQTDEHHDRGYGVAEAAINAPLAAGAAYLAYRAANDGNGAHAMVLTGVAAVSAALTIHGVKTAVMPYHPAGLDFLPTIVDGGAGVSTAGTF